MKTLLLLIFTATINSNTQKQNNINLLLNSMASADQDILLDLTFEKQIFKIKDELKFYISSSSSAKIYIFYLESNGTLTKILPNTVAKNVLIKANEMLQFPTGAYALKVDYPLGNEYVITLVSNLNLDTIEQTFSRGQGVLNQQRAETFLRALKNELKTTKQFGFTFEKIEIKE